MSEDVDIRILPEKACTFPVEDIHLQKLYLPGILSKLSSLPGIFQYLFFHPPGMLLKFLSLPGIFLFFSFHLLEIFKIQNSNPLQFRCPQQGEYRIFFWKSLFHRSNGLVIASTGSTTSRPKWPPSGHQVG